MWEYLNDLDMEISNADNLASVAFSIAVADETDTGIMKGTLHGLAWALLENTEKMQKISGALWDAYAKEEKQKKGDLA